MLSLIRYKWCQNTDVALPRGRLDFISDSNKLQID